MQHFAINMNIVARPSTKPNLAAFFNISRKLCNALEQKGSEEIAQYT